MVYAERVWGAGRPSDLDGDSAGATHLLHLAGGPALALSTTRDALEVGGMWAMLTVLFEFGLGRYVLESPWSELVANYNLAAGRVWVLVPLWMVLGPAAVQQRRIRS